MILGRVDEVDGHFIATRFVAFAVPTACLYIASKSRGASGDVATDGVLIQTEWKSVALGYARVWLPITALAAPIAEMAASGGVRLRTVLACIVLLALAVLAHRAGRLSEDEKARLRLLGTVTGLRIDPSKLMGASRAVKCASLAGLMEKGGIPTTPEGILSVLDDIPLPAMPLVYGYACYAGDTPDWRTCAARCYERYLQGDF